MVIVGGLVYVYFLSKVDFSDQMFLKGIIQIEEGESLLKGGEIEKLYRVEVFLGFDGGINCVILRYKFCVEVLKF